MLEVTYAQPFRTGGNLYRIIIHDYDDQRKLNRIYEVWATLEGIQTRSYGLNNDNPLPSQLAAFAKHFYTQRLQETNYEPKETGAFIMGNGVKYGQAETFTDQMVDEDGMLQTNISLPSSLHEWVKIESAKTKKSLSEVTRLALEQYKTHSFTCTKCGKTKMGLPYFQDETRQHCRECFLKAFEGS